jgi:hypothetical protein
MIRSWEKLANVLTNIGLTLFAVSIAVLMLGATNVSLIGGVIVGVFAVGSLAASVAADHEALECLKRMKEYREEDRV